MNLAHKVRHIGVPAAKQGDVISVLADGDGQATRESRYASEVPALRQTFWQPAKSPFEGKGPAITEYKVMGNVERGE